MQKGRRGRPPKGPSADVFTNNLPSFVISTSAATSSNSTLLSRSAFNNVVYAPKSPQVIASPKSPGLSGPSAYTSKESSEIGENVSKLPGCASSDSKAFKSVKWKWLQEYEKDKEKKVEETKKIRTESEHISSSLPFIPDEHDGCPEEHATKLNVVQPLLLLEDTSKQSTLSPALESEPGSEHPIALLDILERPNHMAAVPEVHEDKGAKEETTLQHLSVPQVKEESSSKKSRDEPTRIRAKPALKHKVDDFMEDLLFTELPTANSHEYQKCSTSKDKGQASHGSQKDSSAGKDRLALESSHMQSKEKYSKDTAETGRKNDEHSQSTQPSTDRRQSESKLDAKVIDVTYCKYQAGSMLETKQMSSSEHATQGSGPDPVSMVVEDLPTPMPVLGRATTDSIRTVTEESRENTVPKRLKTTNNAERKASSHDMDSAEQKLSSAEASPSKDPMLSSQIVDLSQFVALQVVDSDNACIIWETLADRIKRENRTGKKVANTPQSADQDDETLFSRIQRASKKGECMQENKLVYGNEEMCVPSGAKVSGSSSEPTSRGENKTENALCASMNLASMPDLLLTSLSPAARPPSIDAHTAMTHKSQLEHANKDSPHYEVEKAASVSAVPEVSAQHSSLPEASKGGGSPTGLPTVEQDLCMDRKNIPCSEVVRKRMRNTGENHVDCSESQPTSAHGVVSSSAGQQIIECFVEGNPVGGSPAIDLAKVCSFRELWAVLRKAFPAGLPDQLDAKLIYLDSSGDWMLVTRDEHWTTFALCATKLLVTSKC